MNCTCFCCCEQYKLCVCFKRESVFERENIFVCICPYVSVSLSVPKNFSGAQPFVLCDFLPTFFLF